KISNKHKIILAFIVAFTGFLIYSNTLSHGYVLDDYSVIKENWVVKKGTEGISTIMETSYRYGYWNKPGTLYRPLSLVMFAIEWQLSPDNPAPGHFINILFYALSGFLLFLLLTKILKNFNIIIPFIASLIFITHPIHTEVVANIKSRDEIMSVFFVILSMLFLWNHLSRPGIIKIVIALACFLLSILSKEGVITFIAIIPLTIYFFTEIKIRKNLMISSLFILPALIYLYLRKKVIGDIGGVEAGIVDNLLMAAPDFQSKIATSFLILNKYLFKLFIPFPLTADYSYNQIPIVGFGSIKAIFALLVHVGLLVFAIIKIRKKTIISYAILFYLITMSIYSNLIITIGSSFGERFLYIGSIGFSLFIAFILVRLFKKKTEFSGFSKLSVFFKTNISIIGISAIILIIYSFITINRNRDWESNLTLYSADVVKSPNSAHMRYYYGLSVMKDLALNAKTEKEKNEYLDIAINEFSAAAKIYSNYSDAYDQMGLAYFRKNDFTKALKNYNLAFEINPNRPISYNNVGIIYFQQGEYEKALEVYLKAVELNPRYADAYMNLGSVYGTLGKFDLAIENFKKSIEYNPYNAYCHYYLGLTYQSKGDEKNAQESLNKAYQLDPTLKKK
ncbi:MAG: tetratricopeptide repeat protein, partial [Bacteroidota bacterium]